MKRIILWLILVILLLFLFFMISLKFIDYKVLFSNKDNLNSSSNIDTTFDGVLFSFQKSTFARGSRELISTEKDYADYSLSFDGDFVDFCNTVEDKCIKFKYTMIEDEYVLYDLSGNDLSNKYKLEFLSGVYCFLDYTVDSTYYDIYYFN